MPAGDVPAAPEGAPSADGAAVQPAADVVDATPPSGDAIAAHTDEPAGMDPCMEFVEHGMACNAQADDTSGADAQEVPGVRDTLLATCRQIETEDREKLARAVAACAAEPCGPNGLGFGLCFRRHMEDPETAAADDTDPRLRGMGAEEPRCASFVEKMTTCMLAGVEQAVEGTEQVMRSRANEICGGYIESGLVVGLPQALESCKNTPCTSDDGSGWITCVAMGVAEAYANSTPP
jgi:hypothetical protein